MSISHSGFDNNTASWHGGAPLSWIGAIYINNCDFISNEVHHSGGTIYVMNGTINIYWSEFIHNDAGFGRAMCTFDTIVNINQSEYIINRACSDGGAMDINSRSKLINDVVTLNISGSAFYNKADNGGAIIARKVTVTINNSKFIENTAGTGVLYISESNILLSENTTIANNIGSNITILVQQQV